MLTAYYLQAWNNGRGARDAAQNCKKMFVETAVLQYIIRVVVLLPPKGAIRMSELSTSMINEIKAVLETARQNVARQVNNELIVTYWKIGRIIVEHG